jgi:hypothetical protein
MPYVLSWFLILCLLALWSLAAWGLSALAIWSVAQSGQWAGAASGAHRVPLPDWLAPWLPAEIGHGLAALLAGLAPAIDALLQATPALAGGLTVASWVLWGLGSALLLLLGAGLHLVIAMWRRRGGGPGASAGAIQRNTA